MHVDGAMVIVYVEADLFPVLQFEYKCLPFMQVFFVLATNPHLCN